MAGQEKRQVRSIGWRPGIDVWLLLCSTRGMPGHNEVRSRRVRHYVPAQMESQLQGARMDLLALFRSLDRIPLPAHEIPQPILEELFELDGDYAEALAILDEPAIGFDIQAMLRDTQDSRPPDIPPFLNVRLGGPIGLARLSRSRECEGRGGFILDYEAKSQVRAGVESARGVHRVAQGT